jgi:hypothetical protein
MIPVPETILRPGKIEDWNYIDSLRKRESNALGFIPKNSYTSVLSKTADGVRKRFEYIRINVVEDNGDLTGFCYATFHEIVARIQQIVVQEDARRWYRASMLETAVREEAIKSNCVGISCRVAFDLESNFFWKAIGYQPIRQITSTWLNQKESKSKRPLWIYYLALEKENTIYNPTVG